MLMFGHGRTAFAQGCFDCASCFAVIGRRERIWHVVAQRQFLGSLLRHLCFLKACNVFVLRLCCVYIAFTSKFSEFQCTREDHAWLAERNLSELFSMERGCQEYERGFKDAPMLFDCKKSTVCGEDVADHINELRLCQVSSSEHPILSISSLYKRPQSIRPEKMDVEQFEVLPADLRLCVGARSLRLREVALNRLCIHVRFMCAACVGCLCVARVLHVCFGVQVCFVCFFDDGLQRWEI